MIPNPYHQEVSLWVKIWAGLAAAQLQDWGFPKLRFPQVWHKSSVCAISTYHPHRTCGQRGTNVSMMLMQPAVLWVIKVLILDPGVQCLLPTSLKLWQVHLLSCKEEKSQKQHARVFPVVIKASSRILPHSKGFFFFFFWEKASKSWSNFSLLQEEKEMVAGWLESSVVSTLHPATNLTLRHTVCQYAEVCVFYSKLNMDFFPLLASNLVHKNIPSAYSFFFFFVFCLFVFCCYFLGRSRSIWRFSG